MRCRLLRENGRFLTRTAFHNRKAFLCDDESGHVGKALQRPAAMANPMSDPSMMTDMLKAGDSSQS